jgi:hypothetical protein
LARRRTPDHGGARCGHGRSFWGEPLLARQSRREPVLDAGLNAPSLGFTGTPDAITLRSNPDLVEYALTPSSGVETIANFGLGQDELNIDLGDAASSTFEIYNTIVGGQHAVSFFSSADPSLGLVLLNMPAADTAAALLASHVKFAGGHALIS